jgi:hypothetical protein
VAGLMLIVGLLAMGLVAGRAAYGQGSGHGPDGTIEGAQPQAFAAHWFRGTTVVEVNTVSSTPRRCNGFLNEPGVGEYLFIINETKNDSRLSCTNLAAAKANGKLVHGYIKADQTINYTGIEP